MSSPDPYQLDIPVDEIILSEVNPRDISEEGIDQLCQDIESDPSFLIQRPPLLNKQHGKYYCYAGTQRVKAARKKGYNKLRCFVEEGVDKATQERRMIIDNTHRGEWNYEMLLEHFDYTLEELKDLCPPTV